MERPQEEPIDSSVLYVIILNTLAIMVTLIQPVGPINNKEINLKTMVPIRHLCHRLRVPSFV